MRRKGREGFFRPSGKLNKTASPCLRVTEINVDLLSTKGFNLCGSTGYTTKESVCSWCETLMAVSAYKVASARHRLPQPGTSVLL